MRVASLLKTINLTHAGLVLCVILLTVAAGISGLIFRSSQSPIIVAMALLGVVLAVVLLKDPALASCLAIFIALLPRQIVSFIPIPIVRQYTVLLCVLFACFSWIFDVVRHRRNIVSTSTNLIMLAFLFWGVVTLFWAPNRTLGRQQLMPYLIGFATLTLLVNNINSIQNLNRLMTTLALNGWALMLASVITILTGGYMPGTRLKVLEMNENEMGILAIVTMIGVLWHVMRPATQHRRIRELLPWIFLLLTIGLVALSGSRGTAISLLITLLVFCLWKPTRVWGVWGLLVLGLGLLLVPMVFTMTLERFAIMAGDTLLGGREVLWQATWNMILDHLWLGVGIGNARQELIRYLLHVPGIAGAVKAPTHNPLLQIWAETGLPGILLYMGVLADAVWLFTRQYLHRYERGMQDYLPYFALVSSTFCGFMASWIKGGGMESSFMYFLMLSLLLIPASLDLGTRGMSG